jgi:hypothetical protein
MNLSNLSKADHPVSDKTGMDGKGKIWKCSAGTGSV